MAIRFSQSKQYNMRNVFLEKSYKKCGGKTSFRPFSKKGKLRLVWSFIQFVFILYSSRRLAKKKVVTSCFYLIKFFKKSKRGLELASLLHFVHNFSRIIFFMLYFIYRPNFIFWLPLILEILCNACCNYLFPN